MSKVIVTNELLDKMEKNVVVKSVEKYLYYFLDNLHREIKKSDDKSFSSFSMLYDNVRDNYLARLGEEIPTDRSIYVRGLDLPLSSADIARTRVLINNIKNEILTSYNTKVANGKNGTSFFSEYIERDPEYASKVDGYLDDYRKAMRFYIKNMQYRVINMSAGITGTTIKKGKLFLHNAEHQFGLPDYAYDQNVREGIGSLVDIYLNKVNETTLSLNSVDYNLINHNIEIDMIELEALKDKIKNNLSTDELKNIIKEFRKKLDDFITKYSRYYNVDVLNGYLLIAYTFIEGLIWKISNVCNDYSVNSSQEFYNDYYENRYIGELLEVLINNVMETDNKRDAIKEFYSLFDDRNSVDNIAKIKKIIKKSSYIKPTDRTLFQNMLDKYYDKLVLYFQEKFKNKIEGVQLPSVDENSSSFVRRERKINAISNLDELLIFYNNNKTIAFTENQLRTLKAKLEQYVPGIESYSNAEAIRNALKTELGERYEEYKGLYEEFGGMEDITIRNLQDVINRCRQYKRQGKVEEFLDIFKRVETIENIPDIYKDAYKVYQTILDKIQISTYYTKLEILGKTDKEELFTVAEDSNNIYDEIPSLLDYREIIEEQLGDRALVDQIYLCREFNFRYELTRAKHDPNRIKKICKSYGIPFVFSVVTKDQDVKDFIIKQHERGKKFLCLVKVAAKSRLISKLDRRALSRGTIYIDKSVRDDTLNSTFGKNATLCVEDSLLFTYPSEPLVSHTYKPFHLVTGDVNDKLLYPFTQLTDARPIFPTKEITSEELQRIITYGIEKRTRNQQQLMSGIGIVGLNRNGDRIGL